MRKKQIFLCFKKPCAKKTPTTHNQVTTTFTDTLLKILCILLWMLLGCEWLDI